MASVAGDSGGPVIHHTNFDWSRLTAKGIISSGNTLVPCPATAVDPGYHLGNPANGKACYREVAYIAIRRVLADFNLTIATN